MNILKAILAFSLGIMIFFDEVSADSLDVPEDIAEWYQAEPPKKGWLPSNSPKPYRLTDPGVAIYLANYSKYQWVVFKANGKVCVRRMIDRFRTTKLPFPIPRKRAFRGRSIPFSIEDGWLIGFNAGEWGGGLWWFSKDGKRKYRISEDRIVQFISVDNQIYALEGLAHLSRSRGKMIRLFRGTELGSRWTTRTFAILPDAPKTYALSGEDIIVVTSRNLVRVRANGSVETLMSNCFWGATNPNSIVLDDYGVLYIGMKQGVIKWRLSDRPETMQWLVPSEKFLQDELNRFNRRMDR